MKDPQLTCAYHEAGHIIVAMLCGYKVESAQLFGTWDAPADGLQAQTRFAETKCPTAWGDLAVTLAGPIAESVFCARDLLEVLNEGADYEASDLWRARREARRLHKLGLYHTPDHALLVAETRARAMLEVHWSLVAETARALHKQGRID